MPEANEIRGEVSLSLAGTDHVLRPSRDAIRLFEKATGRTLLQLANDAGTGALSIDDAAAIVTECVKAWGKANKDDLASGVNAKRIGDLIMEAGLLVVVKRLELLLFLAATGGYDASGEVRAMGNGTTDLPIA